MTSITAATVETAIKGSAPEHQGQALASHIADNFDVQPSGRYERLVDACVALIDGAENASSQEGAGQSEMTEAMDQPSMRLARLLSALTVDNGIVFSTVGAVISGVLAAMGSELL